MSADDGASARKPNELLYDSEATLRLVDSALAEVFGHEASDPRGVCLDESGDLLGRLERRLENALRALRQPPETSAGERDVESLGARRDLLVDAPGTNASPNEKRSDAA